MCYSAEVWASYKEFIRRHGAEIDIRTFVELYGARRVDASIKLPKAMDAAFADPKYWAAFMLHGDPQGRWKGGH